MQVKMVPMSRFIHKKTQSKTLIKTKTISPVQVRLLYLFSVAFIITKLGAPVYANSHEIVDEVAFLQGNSDSPTDDATAKLLDEVKRSWQALQGSWGKRNQGEELSDEIGSQRPEWTLTGSNEYNEYPEIMKYSVIYTPNPNALAAVVAASPSVNNGGTIEEETPSNIEKRSWKNMNVAWGKRRSAVWNKFRGAWGKREPGWNNLKGMWGKRSTGDWKKLQSAWGKRSQQ